MFLPRGFQRTMSVAKKEVLHVLRDPSTIFFALFIPIIEMFMLGFAIDTNVRNVRTAVLDLAKTQESKRLLQQFENARTFQIILRAQSEQELSEAIVAGKVRVGIKIPEDYSRKRLLGQPTQILVLVDGSESSIAAESVNVSNAIALRQSLEQILDRRELAVDNRPRVLFNPDTRSANFFLPGLMVVMCQILAVMLASTAIVREKEKGTLEQLFMTPVRAGELILGKLSPYLLLAFLQHGMIMLIMVLVFRVPINGSVMMLLMVMLPFVVAMLGMGLWVSTKAPSRDAAQQLGMGTVIPAIFLSGYIFPLDSMPLFFRYFAYLIPTTWLIDAARGVILRGAGWHELWIHCVVLWGMAIGAFLFSTLRFQKRLD